ncbi:ATP-dependent RNA helicase vasa [Drosophila novamexicana]|uniref:ATP-dependent RNA helicase vasa n=1 Tax=Drosophila novamexicana TaxID=47314 RepID=UPI0011E5ABE2|nr:ATP-dependent RNA helicase vasa [Drosophila novamexicana]XP_030555954.1 ATP-dependent RNA helicase vasa [Drosophila novamexicana]XP_030555955.1 ATP-dependent RNA helicase vasa [Drosophila novamexicana]XP_030555957.1 ATP-dependent RNA helicase vasa [Drosophila novamexicana]
MSDWDDEPDCTNQPIHKPHVDDKWESKGEASSNKKTVSEWSDEEVAVDNRQGADGNGNGKGYRGDGQGGGYRGRRDDGQGGGYRGRREDADAGGYRGRRDGGEGGGFRGRRDDGEGGGYRGRRDDGEGGGYRGRRDDGDGGGYRDKRDNDDGEDRRGGFVRERGGFERRRRDDGDMNNNQEDGGEDCEKKAREFYIPPEPTNDETEMFSTGISSGINFAKYDNIPVKVTGENVPQPIKNFESARLRGIVLENVVKSGYVVPTPIQKVSIPVIAEGRDLMACAQTGSGKTAAFLLPILNNILDESHDLEIGKPQAVIVSPTRELAIQIFNEARKFSFTTYLKISLVYGGTSFKYQNECITKGCHVLIATPGRLLDFVDRTFITFDDTRFIVLDEADRMLDMGFSDSMRKIMHHQTMRAEHQTLMFSATFPEEIQRMAGEFLKNYVFVTIGVVGGACSDVQQTVYEVNKFNKRSKLMEILREGADGTIVFVETKRGADFLASFFSETEFPTTSIHGDRLQSQREQALRDFKTGTMKVLIATSVASRGLDIKNVKHVINYDMPTNIDDYVHRIGRTGRVGNSGRATSFFDPEQDRTLAADLIKILEGSGQEVPEFLKEIGGGSSSYCSSKFGGIDVRGGAKNGHIDNLEEEEEWN